MNKKNFLRKIFFILILLILISGCKGKKSAEKSLEEIRSGTQGIVMNFLPNFPPEKVHVDADNTFDVILEVRNLGAFPQSDEISDSADTLGKIYLSGYDSNIVRFEPYFKSLNERLLGGKSAINPVGGSDIVKFTGMVIVDNLNVEKYEPILLTTLCYRYDTISEPSVCIDPEPYPTAQEKKVCEVNDITLSSQGAPIAVTRIDEEAFASGTQFKITIKNVGGGDVIKTSDDSIEKCNPFSGFGALGGEKFGVEDIDKVRLEEIKAGKNKLKCGPFIDGSLKGESGYIRLLNGEGTIVCQLLKEAYGSNTAYITPLQIKLSYVYRTSIQKKIQIIKERIGIGVDSADTRNIN